MHTPPPPPRAGKPARGRGPWATWHRTSAVFEPGQIEAGGATPAARTGGCGTARALEIRRVFVNRFSTSRPQSRGDLGGAPLLFTGRHECEHGHEHLHELAGRPFHLWAGMSARFLRSLPQEKGIPDPSCPPPEHSLAYRRPTGGGS
jgi:hypothetical protein